MKYAADKKPARKFGTLDHSAASRVLDKPAPKQLVVDHDPLLSCWEALDGRVRAILSRDGTVIAASIGARELTAQRQSGLCTTILNLACAPSARKQFRQILDVPVGTVETLILPKPASDGHYVISATGISASAVAIAVRNADAEFTTEFADLEEVFGLTPSELLVIEKLMHGHVPQRIADELDISVHTVRAHLRHCYDKLGVSSREDLWQRLAPYRLN